jgi:hypothetical protein
MDQIPLQVYLKDKERYMKSGSNSLHKYYVVSNEAQLTDSPWQNPYNTAPSDTRNYLTYDYTQSDDNLKPERVSPGQLMTYHVCMKGKNYIHSRRVSDIITLVSEVSGFADFLFVSTAFLMGTFYVGPTMNHALVRHATRVKHLSTYQPKPDRTNAKAKIVFGLSHLKRLNMTVALLMSRLCLPL